MINMNRGSGQSLKGQKKVPKGVALVIVLAIMLCLFLIAGAILILARGHYRATGSQIKRAKAFYLAEAGIQRALWKCRMGDFTSEPAFTIEDPPGSGHFVSVPITITAHPPATPPAGVQWDITVTVDPADVPAR